MPEAISIAFSTASAILISLFMTIWVSSLLHRESPKSLVEVHRVINNLFGGLLQYLQQFPMHV